MSSQANRDIGSLYTSLEVSEPRRPHRSKRANGTVSNVAETAIFQFADLRLREVLATANGDEHSIQVRMGFFAFFPRGVRAHKRIPFQTCQLHGLKIEQ
jgi:hypothetical protein